MLPDPADHRGAILVYVAADKSTLSEQAKCSASDLPDAPEPADLAILLSEVAPAIR